MASNSTYDAAAIQTLEGLEAVRKRPGMYIGGTGSQGLVHLVWELIDNGVDEAAGGFANKIEVIFHRDKSIEVIDNGRGIPIGLSLTHCAECEEEIPEKRRTALVGIKLCIECQTDRDSAFKSRPGFNRRGSKDSQLK